MGAFMRKWVLFLAAAIVVAGGGYYGWTVYSSGQIRAGLDQWIRTLPPGYAVTYKTVEYSVVSNLAKLGGITIAGTGAQTFDLSIDEVEVANPSPDFLAAWT